MLFYIQTWNLCVWWQEEGTEDSNYEFASTYGDKHIPNQNEEASGSEGKNSKRNLSENGNLKHKNVYAST